MFLLFVLSDVPIKTTFVVHTPASIRTHTRIRTVRDRVTSPAEKEIVHQLYIEANEEYRGKMGERER